MASIVRNLVTRFGTEGTLGTEVLGDGELDENGVWRGNLYLRGGGDPTFGSNTYARRFYGGGSTDNKAMIENMRKAHKLADDHEDVATASLLEVFIDDAEKRAWFLFEASRGADRSGH